MADAHSKRQRPPLRPGRGKVWLVGAGPGHPDLLTLQAVKVIRQASVLLIDDLVGDEVVSVARKGLKRPVRTIWVGKRGGCKSTPQAFIEQLMVREALAGERVVRLKGGDPSVFGRSGEEMQALRRAGVEVEVVHGITSGLAAVSALGAPLTHRAHAHGVMFITGHSQPGGDSVDWTAIGRAARSGMTLVVYMGVSRVQALQDVLLTELDGATLAAVVQSASLPQQRQVVVRLDELAQTVQHGGITSPAILVVGDVLKAAAALDSEAGPENPYNLGFAV
jgi:uroporphyrin-III C-methyltransferase